MPTPDIIVSNILEKYGQSFCSAPFNSLHEGPDGIVSTCCKTRVPIGNSKTQTFSEMYNSEHAKNVRKQFLNGEKPDQCIGCWNQEKGTSDIASNRSWSILNGHANIENVVRHTAGDGLLLKQQPAWLDLLWTNKCNFACLGCSPSLSSTYAEKYSKEYEILNGTNFVGSETHSLSQIWKNGNSQKIDYILKHKDTIELIHLNGGEPFMAEDIYELLDVMLKNNLHKKITIWSHTNGSITNGYHGKDIILDYLVHWGDKAKITISNDGFGARGEYVRYGYRDKKWLETFNKIKDANIRYNIQTCTSLFNILVIDEMADWFIANCGDSGTFNGTLTPWYNESVNINLLTADPETYTQAIEKVKLALTSNNTPVFWKKSLSTQLERMYNEMDMKIDPEILARWFNGMKAFDKARGTNFDLTFPELKHFKEKVKDIIQIGS